MSPRISLQKVFRRAFSFRKNNYVQNHAPSFSYKHYWGCGGLEELPGNHYILHETVLGRLHCMNSSLFSCLSKTNMILSRCFLLRVLQGKNLPEYHSNMMEALRSHFPTPGDGAIGALDWPSDVRKRLAAESLQFVCPIRNQKNSELLPLLNLCLPSTTEQPELIQIWAFIFCTLLKDL